MLNIYCWSCGTKISEKEVLGLGHFDQKIGKYQGKAFITFKCNTCKKVRYQIMNNSVLSGQKNSIKKYNETKQLEGSVKKKINYNHVIDFYEFLDEVNNMDELLSKCNMSVSDLSKHSYEKYKNPIVQPLDVFNLFKELNEYNLKRLMILTLDKENYPVTWEFLGEGLDRKISYKPKVIFHTPFLLKEDVSIIIAENLKDISSKPANKDILNTKKLVKTGKILDVEFIDHIIIGEDSYKSYTEANLI